MCQVLYVADSSSSLNIQTMYDRPLSADMSQCQHHLVELVSLPEAPARKVEQTQRQASSGTSHTGLSGRPLKGTAVYVESNALNKGLCPELPAQQFLLFWWLCL